MKTKLLIISTFLFAFYLSNGQTEKRKYLELTLDQLKEIGFVVNDHGIFFKTEVPDDDYNNNLYCMVGYYNTKADFGSKMIFGSMRKKLDKLIEGFADTLYFEKLPALKFDYYMIKIIDINAENIYSSVLNNVETIPVYFKQSEFNFSNKKDIIVYLKATKSLKDKLIYVDKLNDYIVTLMK